MWILKDLKKKLSNNKGFLEWAIPAGIGLASQFFGGDDQPAQSGYDIVNTSKPWVEQGQQKLSGRLGSQYSQIMAGEEPEWMRNYYDPMQQSAQQDLRNRFYGMAGQPGMLQHQIELGAQMGVGPKPVYAKMNQAISGYMSEADKIDQYFNQMRGNYMQQASMQLPQIQSQLYSSVPQNQIVGYNMPGVQGGMDTSWMSSVPWEDVASDVSGAWNNIFNKGFSAPEGYQAPQIPSPMGQYGGGGW